MFPISFIGAGNVAWHLAPALDNTEFSVREVYSRNTKTAAELVSKLYEATVKSSLDFSSSSSRIFILAVPDDAIESVAAEIILPDKGILVHISGSRPLSALGYAANNTGVFYPLQTFTKAKKINFNEIPIFIESEDKETERTLLNMAKAISKRAQKISSAERKVLHIAAVFASNFTNHMLALSKDIMTNHKLDFDWLRPLIAETINKSMEIGPDKAQTGPARRGDLEILDSHVEFLKNDEELSEIYRVISQHILDRYHS